MKKGIVFGTFDLLHIGHLNFLERARKQCDELTVAIQVDPSIERKEKNKPIEPILHRTYRLKSCRYINHIIIYETEEDVKIILATHEFDIRFLGSDYIKEKKHITDLTAIPIKYIDSLPIHSSDLRERIKNG